MIHNWEDVMASKNNADVVIGGKVFRVCGYESEEYLQKVANYINGKIAEYTKEELFKSFLISAQTFFCAFVSGNGI